VGDVEKFLSEQEALKAAADQGGFRSPGCNLELSMARGRFSSWPEFLNSDILRVYPISDDLPGPR
jgi:hypothetical protein